MDYANVSEAEFQKSQETHLKAIEDLQNLILSDFASGLTAPIDLDYIKSFVDRSNENLYPSGARLVALATIIGQQKSDYRLQSVNLVFKYALDAEPDAAEMWFLWFNIAEQYFLSSENSETERLAAAKTGAYLLDHMHQASPRQWTLKLKKAQLIYHHLRKAEHHSQLLNDAIALLLPLRKLAKRSAVRVEVLSLLGRCYFENGDTKHAKETFEAILKDEKLEGNYDKDEIAKLLQACG